SFQTPVGTGFTPTFIDRSTAVPSNGDTIGWRFLGTPILPGAHSAVLVVQTNAHAFTTLNASLIDGNTATALVYSPLPEPASLSLLAIGATALLRRRK